MAPVATMVVEMMICVFILLSYLVESLLVLIRTASWNRVTPY